MESSPYETDLGAGQNLYRGEIFHELLPEEGPRLPSSWSRGIGHDPGRVGPYGRAPALR